ncbi:MAG TPA: DUF305 domain-containing protein [Catenuloplanes sp.]
MLLEGPAVTLSAMVGDVSPIATAGTDRADDCVEAWNDRPGSREKPPSGCRVWCDHLRQRECQKLCPFQFGDRRMTCRTLSRRTSIVAAAALTGLVLSACGDADTAAPASVAAPAAATTAPAVETSSAPAVAPTPTPKAAAPTRAGRPATGPHNDLDEMFATDMIPHHRQAVEMAMLAETRASDPRVKNLAARIGTTQDAEIKTMIAWLKGWRKPVPEPDKAHTAHGPGMMDHAEMEDLKAAKGTAFDRMFCEMMIRHHEGALQMATAVKTRGQNPAVRSMGAEVAKTQKAEVAELRDILTDL